MVDILVQTAHDWGVRPSMLGVCKPEEDKVFMAAFTMSRKKMHAWETQVQASEVPE